MRIAILTVKIPFARGGAEYHAEGLRDALVSAGHEADIVAVPFKWYPPASILDHMLACRLLDITESEGRSVDLAVALRFPAYLMKHPNKIVWLLHQHRPAYELWDHDAGADLIHTPDGAMVRDAIREADRRLLPEARAMFANSVTVAARLKVHCGLDSTPLYHPPPRADAFFTRTADGYLFLPSRLSPIKRQQLVLEALACTRHAVRVAFSGPSFAAGYEERLQAEALRLGVAKRVQWLGAIDDQEKLERYARCLAVVFPPFDEDYGYVTLEAMLAGKPVITCSDSGGPLEFVVDGETGLVAEPRAEALAEAMDVLWEDRERAAAMGLAARERYARLGITWENVVRALLGSCT